MKLIKGIIAIIICSYLFTLLMWLADKERGKQKYTQEQKQKSFQSVKPYYEVPFRIKTYKEEFDSLGINIIFWTGTEHQLVDSLKSLDLKISSLPKTREQQDLAYPKIQQSYWLPHRFILYADGYFIWEGNRMSVFIAIKERYPTCRFILIGEKKENIFFTKEMYTVVF